MEILMEIILVALLVTILGLTWFMKRIYNRFSMYYQYHLRDAEIIAEYFSIYQQLHQELVDFDNLGAYESSDEFAKFFSILRKNLNLLQSSSIISKVDTENE